MNRVKKALERLQVIIDKFGEKYWVGVQFYDAHDMDSSPWLPSFEQLFWIAQGICWCEDQKYYTTRRGKGRFMVRDFLSDCCEATQPGQTLDERWNELADKYRLSDN